MTAHTQIESTVIMSFMLFKNKQGMPGRGLEPPRRSEEHTSELQPPCNIVCRLLLAKKETSKTHAPSPKPATLLPKLCVLLTVLGSIAFADQPPPPCHPNPNATQGMATVANRGNIRT